MAVIVVGVDGSGHSRCAVAWALDEARLRDARGVVVATRTGWGGLDERDLDVE